MTRPTPLHHACARWGAWLPLLWLFGMESAVLQAEGSRVEQVSRQTGIDQNLDALLPLDLVFRDERGAEAPLRRYFDDKPVVLMFVQYECPMLCNVAMDGVVRSLRGLQFTPGEEFVLLTVSFDPKETPDLARRKKRNTLKRFGRDGAERGWHFLTGDEETIGELTGTAGFRYTFDTQTGQYAHAAGLIVATPEGRLSRYFYGIEYPPRDLRLGLVEASANRIGTATDQVLLLCYRYDPRTGKYGLAIDLSLKIAGLTTVFLLGTYVVTMLRRERRSRSLGGTGDGAAAQLSN